jgi:hypothetical protein
MSGAWLKVRGVMTKAQSLHCILEHDSFELLSHQTDQKDRSQRKRRSCLVYSISRVRAPNAENPCELTMVGGVREQYRKRQGSLPSDSLPVPT